MSFVDKITKAIGMPVETVNNAISFMGELVAPSLKEAALIPYDHIREYRYRKQIDILLRTKNCLNCGLTCLFPQLNLNVRKFF